MPEQPRPLDADTARDLAPPAVAPDPPASPEPPAPPDILQRDVQRWLAYERTHLANERTYAAWLRTGLSVAAMGIAVAHFLPGEIRTPAVTLSLGAGFVVAGVVLIAFGAWRYGRTHGDLLKSGGRTRLLAPKLVYIVAGFLAALLVLVLLLV